MGLLTKIISLRHTFIQRNSKYPKDTDTYKEELHHQTPAY